MFKHIVSAGLLVLVETACLTGTAPQAQWENARRRMSDLRFGSYATSRQVERLATDETFRARVWQAIQTLGITKLYVEVYRGGHVVSPDQLVFVRDWLRQRGLDVVGGIATVPGGEIGVRQEGPLDWFNWQNDKTRRDLEKIVRTAAPLFDSFIIDDFLCTGDVSEESKRAKGDRSWGEYRRALMTRVAQSVFVGPAHQMNPGITMIVKYPQWYDRFHLFGYDTQRLPLLFDRVWVGTETRGRSTQRFGFVQPYEGFVNYRWLAGIAGDKIGGAWFDHGDCAEYDFLDQAYMSVLAGAPELVFFNLGDIVTGHPDHEKVVAEFERLVDLAAFVRTHPVTGVPAYKPPNSEPYGDMYLMDFLGMLGIPLVPVHQFPEGAPVVLLPAQAATDPDLLNHVNKAMAKGVHVIVTASLLITLSQGGELARMVGVDPNIKSSPTRARCATGATEVMIDLEAPIETTPRLGDIVCTASGKTLLLLRTVATPDGTISLLHTHTYNQADFDAVGEVLLCPRRLGLLSLDGPPLSSLRAVFGSSVVGTIHDGPSGVTFHPFSGSGGLDFVLQNFNARDVSVSIRVAVEPDASIGFMDRFTGRRLPFHTTDSRVAGEVELTIPARGRAWVQEASRGP
ncbi:MAG: hypothetical protein JW955_09315 [Sedimentisphaerales bacterium]|nr:hypothetical protein [Sedimentisphaerales bacterium]